MADFRGRLKALISKTNHWVEIRYHQRHTRSMSVLNGLVSHMNSGYFEGVGIRTLVNGTMGFASTADLSSAGLEKALKVAEEMARELQIFKKEKIVLPFTKNLAKGDFFIPGYEELQAKPLEEKFHVVRDSEEKIRNASKSIESAQCMYKEIYENKIIITSDGADAHIKLARPEFRFIAFASDGTQKTQGNECVGGTGGWECLFRNRKIDECIGRAASNAVNLLTAQEVRGGKKKVILSPSVVGILSHEAIGHTVEADLVNSGSVARDKWNKEVASPLVNLCDSGVSENNSGAAGTIPIDDEGVIAEKTYVIKRGKLVGYLHNRETAAQYGVEPTGNARAWEFNDEPLIRMRNTYIEPGESELDDMIGGIEEGYFIDGALGGQADFTGEFMFAANKCKRIKNGKLAENVQRVAISGIAFDTLKTVDAISKDFIWDLGAGYCGKGQPARVDAGGPYIRCELLVGGAQS